MYRRLLVASLAVGCSGSGTRGPAAAPSPRVTTPTTTTATAAPAAQVGCDDRVAIVDGGHERDTVCAGAIPNGSTIVDLRDAWAPVLFAVQPDGTAPDFRPTYLALALEQDVDGKRLSPNVGLAELYGVVPSFAIVRERFAQTARYVCHAKVDSAPIAKITRPYGEELAGLVRFNNRQRALLGAVLERNRVQRNLPDYTALAADRELGPTYERWKVTDDLYSGILAAQHHLVCEGSLSEKEADGTFSWAFGQALEQFQRRNFLIPNGRLDPETRAALATDPRELDFRFALRVLRERVVDATGLIEDGTASTGPQPILGRMLDPEGMRMVHGRTKAMPHGAPDLVGAATEAAAKQLGWTDPAATGAFLASHPGGMRVALALPATPAYHSAHMDLSAEIDRGDVWYDEKPVPRVAWVRPAMVLYAQDGATKRALVRWPTTIGGWSDVVINGAMVKRWKESEVGPREWHALYAAPTWLPPGPTPDEELLKWVGKNQWELKRTIMGPGPMAAFGMMLLPNSRAVRGKDGVTQWVESGIGTHGSAVVTSIVNGTSHGCHRLYNHLALRLGGFLLDHRTHVVKGQEPEHYRRAIRAMGKTFVAKIDTRGFVYELTPPVHVEVLPGTIRSQRKTPPAASVAAGAE